MKARYRAVLFDLDGTLTDSGPGIASSVLYALEQMGFPAPPPEELRRFVGPPLFTSFTQFCGMTAAQAEKAITLYRSVYNTRDVYKSVVYPGVPETLCALREAGAYLAVVTSKPGNVTDIVLKHFNLRKYFDGIRAVTEKNRDAGKEGLILAALDMAGVSPAGAVMIGDTKFDARGARLAGTAFVGALYGFGTREEMAAEGASVFARKPAEFASLLIDTD